MADDTQEKLQKLTDFIEDRIARGQKALRLTWAIGLVLLALVTGYMAGVVWLVRGMLEPRTAAAMIANHAEANLPAVLEGTEAALMAEGPAVADALSRQILGAMPALREDAEFQIDTAYREMLPLLREEIRSTVRVHAEVYKDELVDYYRTHTQPDFPKTFIDRIAADVAAAIDSRLRKAAPGKGLEHVEDRVMRVLDEMNAQLGMLLTKKTGQMTRSERLQRRLIVSWVQALNELMKKRGR